ncbi:MULTISPECIES: TetR/AcrR family transcriptional regulator [unclassified Streptomyces]|uniref:TetR/AcrR family transcriptional regulator n=1 Tax=unclassified Streptomyces TaxID=2593676 RepID=UPI00190D7773|nr:MULTISPECIES: TetR family transcriptional regulator [unclassified Streptomyces]MBK3570862.1 TetR/AcrR family transcriptional regulator [Streptomyces sp. MBT62]MBK6017616.1 TetR/AcrR family transcriptional regulator [Streptomyces sp. MBT53]
MARTDGRIERGNRTRQLVLRRTVDIASVEGLEALSVGRLALELDLSKSGVFALFGSKQELQLATVREAARIFTERVVLPALATLPGVGRLWQLCDLWLEYSRGRVFPGGCFFYEVIAEFDARSGPVHDAVLQSQRDWTAHVEGTVEEAKSAGELLPDIDAGQLAFELVALMETANMISVLHNEEEISYGRARAGIRARLRAAAVDPALVPGS